MPHPLRPLLGLTAVLALLAGTSGTTAVAAANGPTYLKDDYSEGRVFSILPPGEHGLYNATDLLAFETNKTRPLGSVDQKVKYDALIYGAPSITDATLGTYFNPETFGIKPGELTRTETPSANVPVTIYRDRSDVPHIYGDTDEATEFGAGFAGAEDRLFLMDVLRHYGRGNTSEFLGPSCADEIMDHDQLLLTGYSDEELQAQFDNLDKEYGAQGARFKKLFTSFVAGINAYIAKTVTDPTLLPGDYAAASGPPQPWTVQDIIAIAGLVGGIFGKGGGGELSNARLLQYLTKEIGAAQASTTLKAFRGRNDPLAPTTTEKPFPYDIPGKIDPASIALPDAGKPLTGGPKSTTPNCDLTSPNVGALTIVSSVLQFPKMLSNALVVDAKHSSSGHPLAVFGPQVGYFTPQILMEQELHGPDLIAEGASFAGTNGVVELGRGVDYAWSATSASTDNVDTRVERLCNPTGGAVTAEQKSYLFKGKCLAMKHHTFSETGLPKAGGMGAPVVLNHELYYTVHGPVQGWTTSGGKPVAITSQRSTYGHELDSGIGFLAWNTPSLTHDATSWMKGAGQIGYTFNWLYLDNRDIAYYLSGANPVRPKSIDPDFPTWGDGTAEWRGMQPAAEHPHEINPPKGWFTSWNNKPAPMFSAHDTQYSYNGVYRSLSLDEALLGQFAKHGGKITRANLVQAMSTASTVDLSGRRVLPELLPYLPKVALSALDRQMVALLKAWLATGAHRIKSSAAATQYEDAAAVAIMDELYPRLIRAFYDPLFAKGGLDDQDGLTFSYSVFPQRFADTPNARGEHLGSAYDGGFEGFLLTSLRQLRGVKVADAFPSPITSRVCGGNCPAAIAKAFHDTAAALTTANGSASAASWVDNTANKAAGQTQPVYDAIQYKAVAVAGQSISDWQNRPTFQQVATFFTHRTRAAAVLPPRAPRGRLAATGPTGVLTAFALLLLGIGVLLRRRTTYR